MTKKELKKILNKENTVIVCMKDYGAEVGRYGRKETTYTLSSVQKKLLLNNLNLFSEYFSIISEDTFRDDECIYMIAS